MAKHSKNKVDIIPEEDIFMQSAMQSMDEQNNLQIVFVQNNTQPITDGNIDSVPIVARKSFQELGVGMDEEHAERFNRVLNALPDREFVRVYLKTLEFFKPKITRTEGDFENKKDSTINILIKR